MANHPRKGEHVAQSPVYIYMSMSITSFNKRHLYSNPAAACRPVQKKMPHDKPLLLLLSSLHSWT
jgi:hypothetical protein